MSKESETYFGSQNRNYLQGAPVLIAPVILFLIGYFSGIRIEGNEKAILILMGGTTGFVVFGYLMTQLIDAKKYKNVLKHGISGTFYVDSSFIGLLDFRHIDGGSHLARELHGKLSYGGKTINAVINGSEYLFTKDTVLDCVVWDNTIAIIKKK